MDLGGAPPTTPGRRKRAADVGLFLACLGVVGFTVVGLVYGIAVVMLSFVGAMAP